MSDLLTSKELKEHASIVDLLERLGYKPARGGGKEKMYRSMLRDDDRSPSFTVNDELGVWFDHGTRKGGNIIDLGLAYWPELQFQQVVRKIQELLSLQGGQPKTMRPRLAVKLPHYIVEEVKDLGTHPAITNYLKNRGVFEMAKPLLSEVYYYVEDQNGNKKHFFAAGWQNEHKGWEVRNRYFKGCLGRKGLTFIPGHLKKTVVFEGLINYLSWKAGNPHADESAIILNTLSLLPVGVERAKAFSSVDLYFDRDHPGYKATVQFVKALPYATDKSKVYEGYNDYNDKLTAEMKNTAGSAKKADFFHGVAVPFSR